MAAIAAQPFLVQRAAAQSAGITLVRNILKKNSFPDGVTTRELFKLAIQEPPPENFTPFNLKVLGPQPLGPRMPKGKSPPNAKPRILLSNHPEHPEHPIRSIRFLKEYVLPHLEGQNEISMKRISRPLEGPVEPGNTKRERLAVARLKNKWAWKVIPPEERPVPPAPPKEKQVIGTEVGVGEDVSHLNRRRSKARVKKVSKQVGMMKVYRPQEAQRDKLFDKIEKNPYVLKKVFDSLHANPDADVGSLFWGAVDARKNMPKEFWQEKPIEDEKSERRLRHIRKHLAWRQPDILNR